MHNRATQAAGLTKTSHTTGSNRPRPPRLTSITNRRPPRFRSSAMSRPTTTACPTRMPRLPEAARCRLRPPTSTIWCRISPSNPDWDDDVEVAASAACGNRDARRLRVGPTARKSRRRLRHPFGLRCVRAPSRKAPTSRLPSTSPRPGRSPGIARSPPPPHSWRRSSPHWCAEAGWPSGARSRRPNSRQRRRRAHRSHRARPRRRRRARPGPLLPRRHPLPATPAAAGRAHVFRATAPVFAAVQRADACAEAEGRRHTGADERRSGADEPIPGSDSAVPGNSPGEQPRRRGCFGFC